MIELKRNKKAIELLYFFYDPIVIEEVKQNSIVLNVDVTVLPKPLRKYKLKDSK
jgi:hypothetical protein